MTFRVPTNPLHISHLSTQWAAVRILVGEMIDPPQPTLPPHLSPT
jgi:hypothetical protein